MALAHTFPEHAAPGLNSLPSPTPAARVGLARGSSLPRGAECIAQSGQPSLPTQRLADSPSAGRPFAEEGGRSNSLNEALVHPGTTPVRSGGVREPLAADLFCGLGGWTEGLLSDGWRVRGYDIEEHVYGDERYPGEFVLRDILQMHGREIADVDLIVSSSPCTDYSYMAMPWTRAKAKAAAIRADVTGEALRRLNALFDAQFRIQREACEAAGRYIPMVVENVRGAQPWVGQARGSFGSYYLWGDVPALMPAVVKATKVPGFRFDGSGRSFQTAAVNKHVADICGPRHNAAGIKQGGSWFHDNKSASRMHSSKSPERKRASAQIAKIPFALSSHIARVFKPRQVEAA